MSTLFDDKVDVTKLEYSPDKKSLIDSISNVFIQLSKDHVIIVETYRATIEPIIQEILQSVKPQ